MWAIAALGVAIIGAVVISYARPTEGANIIQVLAALSLVGGMLAFVLSGALIVSRQPRNIVGWLLMIPGLALPASLWPRTGSGRCRRRSRSRRRCGW